MHRILIETSLFPYGVKAKAIRLKHEADEKNVLLKWFKRLSNQYNMWEKTMAEVSVIHNTPD